MKNPTKFNIEFIHMNIDYIKSLKVSIDAIQ